MQNALFAKVHKALAQIFTTWRGRKIKLLQLANARKMQLAIPF